MPETRPIAVGPVRITEPATMATDFLIGTICVVFAVDLNRDALTLFSARGLWASTFTCTAIAAIIGGVVHGFALHLTAAAKERLWKATQYTMGLTSLAIVAAAALAFSDGVARQWLLGLAVAKFLAYAVVVARRDEYSVVVVDYGVSMLVLTALATAAWWRNGPSATPLLLAGVVVSAVAAAVQVAKIAPHSRFNHNDLYHVIQIVALYLFYRGGLRLGDG
jgi:hypothetical protein